MESSEKVLVFLMGKKLNISKRGTLVIKKANSILRSLSNNVGSRYRGVILPLTTGDTLSLLVTPHQSSVSSSGLPSRKDMDRLEQGQQKIIKMIERLEHLS